MLKRIKFTFFVVLLFSGVLAQNESSSPETSSNAVTDLTSPSSVSTPSSPTSPSPATSSTNAPATSSSSSPTESTTSSPAEPTTSSPSEPTSSTAAAPTSSTATPTPSPTAGPSTTVAPEPVPKAEEGKWNVTEGNHTCIRAELKALFMIPINDGKVTYIALSPNASESDSSCESSNITQKLVLTDTNYKFTLEFEKSDNQVYVKDIAFSYNVLVYSGDVHSANNSKFFLAKNGNSYLCNSNLNISLENVTLTLSDLHVQAFGKKDNTGFTVADECENDDKVSQIVPIAVGCALAALVVVVLIAYLVGRRRSRQKGYQSV